MSVFLIIPAALALALLVNRAKARRRSRRTRTSYRLLLRHEAVNRLHLRNE